MSETYDLKVTLAANGTAPAETVLISVTSEDPRNAISALGFMGKRQYLTNLWDTIVNGNWEEYRDDDEWDNDDD